jgi:hypothetical protein
MSADISRRELLKAAGGLTFLGLVPATRGRYVLEASSPTRAQPVFTALPYVQPGDNSRLVPHREQAVLAWQTDATPAEFTVVFGGSDRYGNAARVTAVPRQSGDGADADARLNYAAAFGGLALGTRYHYRVSLGARVVAEGYFTTRKPRGAQARFVSFGDNSLGDLSERAIACQAYRARPDFVMNTGDNVYGSGLDHEYAHHFFPVYNADRAAPEVGAPLLRSLPFYALIGNHDVTGVTAGHHPVADFDRHADSLGYFTNMHLPLNAPLHPQPTPIVGAPARLAAFRACAGVATRGWPTTRSTTPTATFCASTPICISTPPTPASSAGSPTTSPAPTPPGSSWSITIRRSTSAWSTTPSSTCGCSRPSSSSTA